MKENMIVIRAPKTSCFNFDWSKDVDEKLKHDIEFIAKSNESLAEYKIKNDIEQLLLKYKHGSNIHEHRKQQDEWLHDHVYIYGINNRFVFKIKDGHKLKLQTLETLKLFGSTKNIYRQNKKWRKRAKSWISILILCNSAEVWSIYTFTPNKCYAYLLNAESRNLVFLKTYNTEFDEIIITLKDQNGKSLKIEHKINITLLINKYKRHALRA